MQDSFRIGFAFREPRFVLLGQAAAPYFLFEPSARYSLFMPSKQALSSVFLPFFHIPLIQSSRLYKALFRAPMASSPE